jgi:hypothetical protein
MNLDQFELNPRPVERLIGLLSVAILALALSVAFRGHSSAAPVTSSIVTTYGVGGVLRTDGNLYQWRPEQKKWVTIDESFRIDGETTRHVLPLPVPASDVARMEGFGFLVTRSGACWLYNLDSNRWENIGRP